MEGYMCIVNLTKDGPTYSYNLPQLQKLPCAHVIAAYAQEKYYANISTYLLWTITVRLMLNCFIMFIINDIGQGEVGLLSYYMKLKGRQVAHLLFVYLII